METWEIVGRLAISELHGCYAHAVDRGDIGHMSGLFTRDGVLVVHGGRVCTGRGGILEFMIASRRSRETSGQGLAVRHHVSSVSVKFRSRDEATGSCRFLAIGPGGADHWGVYHDEFAVEDGVWRYARRAVTIEGADPRGWIGSGSGAVSFTPEP